MNEPIRRKPDYNEQEFSVDQKKDEIESMLSGEDREVYAVAGCFSRDFKAGIFSEIPLPHETYEDCLIEYGVPHRLGDRRFQRDVARRVNHEIELTAYQKIASRESSLAVRLARKFAYFIHEGQLPRNKSYSRVQAVSFLEGALGHGRATEDVLHDFSVAHNVANEDLGLIEMGGRNTLSLLYEPKGA
jgi:hypothetical protein